MSFFDKINNYLIVNAIKEIPKGRDPEESLPETKVRLSFSLALITTPSGWQVENIVCRMA